LYSTTSGTSLPKKAIKRHTRGLKARASSLKSGRRSTAGKRGRNPQVKEELLQLVQTGVEEFILRHATVEEFMKMTRALAEKENLYSHQLTKSIFSKIVKQAIMKRTLRNK
jgi:hypothetical protein